jgi:prenyltransferase beta subunit
MRPAFVLTAVLFAAPAARAQTADVVERVETSLWVLKLQDKASGGFKPDPDGKPGLRATSAAVRTLKYNDFAIKGGAMGERVAAFVMSCYNPASGGFADAPGGKPDVNMTSVGVMAAVELGVQKEKFRKAMDYLKEHAKTWEEVRLAAAAVEAWGVKDCPFEVKPWAEAGQKGIDPKLPPIGDGGARQIGSVTAFTIRLGLQKDTDSAPDQIARLLDRGQLPDGGWKKQGETGSDLETTYRVMRAYHLLKAAPKDATKLREFLGKCRNPDGGYGVKPGEKSSAGATYYASTVRHWLDGMEKK